MNFWVRHFPKTKEKWKIYSKIFIPIILASSLFALNGVIDNFMVGHINQGQAALGAINSWTSILTMWFVGVSSAGSILAGQFYFAKKYEVVKEVARYRYYLCLLPAIGLAIFAWISPDLLTKTFYHGDQNNNYNVDVLTNARQYAKVIALQWILISITFNLGNQLRELGYGKITMYWGFGTLTANVALNSILMYGVKMGVEGAAWASVAGRLVALTVGISALYYYKLPLNFKPWTIFQVSWETRKLIWRRWIYILSIFTGGFFVIFRTSLYDMGYAENSLGIGVSGLSVAALTGALMNVFTTTFSALSSMAARFVASELGKNNLEQAKINADEIKGFATLAATVLSIGLMIFALCVPYMTFLAQNQYFPDQSLKLDGQAQLKQVSYSLLIICIYYPIWIWFSASYRCGSAGGKGSYFAIVDWLVSGLQLGWLALIVLKIVPGWTYAEQNLWVTYIIFFLSDGFKLLFTEWKYYHYQWLHSLTQDKVVGMEFKGQSEIQELAEVKNE